MRRLIRSVVVVALLLGAGCREPASSCGGDCGIEPVDAPAPPPPDEVDLLLMIDNSNSMAGEQGLFGLELGRMVRILVSGDRDEDGTAELTPVRSLHLGVVTSDMGAGPSPPPGPEGRRPELRPGARRRRRAPHHADVDDPRLDLRSELSAGLRLSVGHGPTPLLHDFGCVASVRTGGCGFEQQLEAVLKAVSPNSPTASYVPAGYVPRVFVGASHGDGANDGFVRRDSVLAIFLLTDEEDCSVPDYSIFYRDSRFASVGLNLRCFAFPDWLYPTARYVDGLLALRSDPGRLVYAAVVGIPTEVAGNDASAFERMLAHPYMIETPDPSMSPPSRLLSSCTTADGGEAFPPRRIVEVARALDAAGAHATVQSICASDFRPAANALMDEIFSALGGT